jgi:hypothetical protein
MYQKDLFCQCSNQKSFPASARGHEAQSREEEHVSFGMHPRVCFDGFFFLKLTFAVNGFFKPNTKHDG